MDECCAPQACRDFTVEELEMVARTCHEANRGVCIANGDISQPTWGDAPGWQRASCFEGVKKRLECPHSPASQMHDWWLGRKLREGWRYGPRKSVKAKVHPCLLPYHELPPHEKIKDDVFSAVVSGYIRALRDTR